MDAVLPPPPPLALSEKLKLLGFAGLEIDPTYGPALQVMKEIAKNAENWDAYAEHLISAQIVVTLSYFVWTLGRIIVRGDRRLEAACMLAVWFLVALAGLFFQGREARALVAGAAAHSLLALDEAGTGAVAMLMLASAHAGGWPVARGGSAGVAEAQSDCGGVA